MVIDILIFIFIASFIAIVVLGHLAGCRGSAGSARRPTKHTAIPPPARIGV
jgi:hypothetical protein